MTASLGSGWLAGESFDLPSSKYHAKPDKHKRKEMLRS